MISRQGMTLYETIFSIATLAVVTSSAATLMTRGFEMTRRSAVDRRDEAVLRTLVRQFRRDVHRSESIEADKMRTDSDPETDSDSAKPVSITLHMSDAVLIRYEVADGLVTRVMAPEPEPDAEGPAGPTFEQPFPLSDRMSVELRTRPLPTLDIERVDVTTGIRTPYRRVTAQPTSNRSVDAADREDVAAGSEIEEVSDEK